MDPLLYRHMEQVHLIESGGFTDKVRRRKVGAVIDRAGGEFAQAAADNGHRNLRPPGWVAGSAARQRERNAGVCPGGARPRGIAGRGGGEGEWG